MAFNEFHRLINLVGKQKGVYLEGLAIKVCYYALYIIAYGMVLQMSGEKTYFYSPRALGFRSTKHWGAYNGGPGRSSNKTPQVWPAAICRPFPDRRGRNLALPIWLTGSSITRPSLRRVSRFASRFFLVDSISSVVWQITGTSVARATFIRDGGRWRPPFHSRPGRTRLDLLRPAPCRIGVTRGIGGPQADRFLEMFFGLLKQTPAITCKLRDCYGLHKIRLNADCLFEAPRGLLIASNLFWMRPRLLYPSTNWDRAGERLESIPGPLKANPFLQSGPHVIQYFC